METTTDCTHGLTDETCAVCLGTAAQINGCYFETSQVTITPHGTENLGLIQAEINLREWQRWARIHNGTEIGQNTAPNDKLWRHVRAPDRRLHGIRVEVLEPAGRPAWLPANYWSFGGTVTNDDGSTGERLPMVEGFDVTIPAAEQADDEPDAEPGLGWTDLSGPTWRQVTAAADGDIDERREAILGWRARTRGYPPV